MPQQQVLISRCHLMPDALTGTRRCYFQNRFVTNDSNYRDYQYFQNAWRYDELQIQFTISQPVFKSV